MRKHNKKDNEFLFFVVVYIAKKGQHQSAFTSVRGRVVKGLSLFTGRLLVLELRLTPCGFESGLRW